MDIKHLDYFREIVDSQFNLSKAASKLHITQPSLSMLVTSWEKQYGIKLFNKNKGRYIGLTKEGEYIYNHSIQLLEMHNNFLYALEEIKQGFKGNVKIGIPPLIISLLFNKCILEFISDYPNIQLNIVEEGAMELQNQLANGDIDIAILIEPLAYDFFNTTTLYEDKLVAVINNSLPISVKSKVSLFDISNEKQIIFSENFVLHKTITEMFKNQFLHPNITFQTSQWDLIIDIVKNTDSVAIMPAPVAPKLIGTDAIVRELVPEVPWTVLMATNKSKIKTPSVKFFEEYMINYFRTQSQTNIVKQIKPINIR
ncbi:DNA-binding transcriptional LysR family regulator [Bacilli bacterium PM5-3]|nr:DNA-binding transcriptional LysR family regulator [Bacilli bacterium PM5-3]MDH6603654.1 DNA-binding transcriptional LysR family regulator [Bacilli bacterium PM5-9]